MPMEIEPPLEAGLPTEDGGVLLSAAWLGQVSDAYLETDVMDALEVENWYEEWQVVSVRVAPCGPLGSFQGHLHRDCNGPLSLADVHSSARSRRRFRCLQGRVPSQSFPGLQ